MISSFVGALERLSPLGGLLGQCWPSRPGREHQFEKLLMRCSGTHARGRGPLISRGLILQERVQGKLFSRPSQ